MMGNKGKELWTCIYREGNIACMQRKQIESSANVNESRKICELCLRGQQLDIIEEW